MTSDEATMRPVRELVSELSRLKRQQNKTDRNVDLRFAAIDAGEGIYVVDQDGNDVVHIGGEGVQVIETERPGRASTPTAIAGLSAATLMWDGLTAEGERALRGTVADVHMSTEEGFEPTSATLSGTIESLAGSTTIVKEPGWWQVRLVLRNSIGESDPSDAIQVNIESVMDDWQIREELAGIREILVDTIMAQGNRDGLHVPTAADAEGAEDGVVYYRRETMPNGPAFEMYQLQGGNWVLLELTDGVFRYITTDKLIAGSALIGSTLIGPESIATSHLYVTESMTAAIAEFLKVRAEHLDVDYTDPSTGYRIQITPKGIIFWGPEGNLAMSLTTDSLQYQRIFNSDGQTVVSMDAEGVVNVRELNAEDGISLGGQPLAAALANGPRGVVPGAWMDLDMRSISTTQSLWGFAEMAFRAEAGRNYQIVVQPFTTVLRGGAPVFRIHRANNAVATVLSPTIHTEAVSGNVGSLQRFGGSYYFSSLVEQDVSLLLSLAADAGIEFSPANGGYVRAQVYDVGPYGLASVSGARARNSTVTLPADTTTPAITQREYRKDSTTWRSYGPTGTTYTDQWTPSLRVQQGLHSGAVLRSLVAFNPDLDRLSGADVTEAFVDFTVSGTSQTAGAWIDINLHGYSTVPGSGLPSSLTYVGQVFAKPGQRVQFKIPATHHAGIASGAYRGVAFGNGSMALTRRAHIAAATIQWRVRYQK